MKILLALALLGVPSLAQVQLGKNVQIGAGSTTVNFITSLTTTGTSGPASVASGVLNIPQYTFNFTLGATPITAGSTITAVTGLSVNGVTLNAAGSSTLFLNQAGGYTTPAGGGTGNTTSTSLTTNTIPKANGANSLINSGLTDDGTSLSYTGAGTANGISFPASSTPVTPAAATVIYESDSSGNAAISENGAAASRVCTAGNGQCPGGTGSVTSVSVVTANGVSGTVATPTTTPAITLTLGAITPTTVASAGAISTTNGAVNVTQTGAGNQIPIDAADSALATGNTSVLEVGLDTGGNDSAVYGFKNVGGTTSALNLGVIGITSGAQTTFNNAGNWTIPGTINGVPLTAAGSSSLFLNQAGGYTTPAGGGSGVQYNASTTNNLFYGDSRFIVASGCTTDGSTAGAITAWSITSNVLTITSANSLTAGEALQLFGFGTSTFFNGQNVVVSATGLSGTQFQVPFTHANGSATEAGKFGCTYNWPRQAATRPFFATHGTVTNGGISGGTVAIMNSNYTANAHPLSPAVTGFPGFLFLQAGYNDANASCLSAASIEASYQTLWATAHTDGWTVVQTSIPLGPFNTTLCPGGPAAFAAVNNWLRGQSKTSTSATGQFWDKFIDIAQVLSDDTNLTLFNSDTIHMNDAGDSLAAELTNQAMGVQGSSLQAYFTCTAANNCAALNAANVFTADQTISKSGPTFTLNDTASGGAYASSIFNNGGTGIPYLAVNGSFFGSYHTVSSHPLLQLVDGCYGFNATGAGAFAISNPAYAAICPVQSTAEFDFGNGTYQDKSGTIKAAAAFFSGLGSSTSPLCTTTGGQLTNSGCSTLTGTSPIVVSGGTISCPTCGTSTATSVTINGGSSLGTANINGTTPAAPGGNTNVTFQVSGSNVSAYVPTSGGGGSGLFSGILSAPTIAGTGLTSAINNSGTSTFANVGNGIKMSDTSTVPNVEAIVKAYPGAPFTLTALISLPISTGSFANLGLTIADTLTGKLMVFGLQANSNWAPQVSSYTNPTTFSASLLAGSMGYIPPFLWLRLKDDGTNISYSISVDGNNFSKTPIYTVAKSASFLGATGFNFIGAFISPQGANSDTTLMSWTITTP
jgi:hypothetical protein